MDILDILLRFTLGNCKKDIVGHTMCNDYTVDTCFAGDTKMYETAIWHNFSGLPMVVVEEYKTREKAEKGHSKWEDFCFTNPVEVYSIQTNRNELLTRSEL